MKAIEKTEIQLTEEEVKIAIVDYILKNGTISGTESVNIKCENTYSEVEVDGSAYVIITTKVRGDE